MADLEGFHLANILRMTHAPRSVKAINNQDKNATAAAHSNNLLTVDGIDDHENHDEDDEDGNETVTRALTKVHEQYKRNVLDFKAMLSSRLEHRRDQVLSNSDFPPLEEEVEYGMEDAGFVYRTPIWPTIDDSDDTETISDTESL